MQGGCMAIEDGYQLSLTLDEAVQSVQPGAPVDIEGALRKYQSVSGVLEGCETLPQRVVTHFLPAAEGTRVVV